jgi:Fe-Mn family superoxide dismutase
MLAETPSKPVQPPVLPIRPLPFNPAKLNGISEKLVLSHHQNNYGGAVKNLNAVRAQLAQTGKEAPAFLVGGLRAKELAFGNSVTLHEAYFENLGGSGKADGSVRKALDAAWGSFDAWEAAFRATATSLAGGSGWVILDLHVPTGEMRISWAGDHTQTLAAGYPLLVMDMYEHAYQMDYGAAAAKYIDSFFTNLQWDEVNRRYERGQKLRSLLQG